MHNSPPLIFDPNLCAGAEKHAEKMAQRQQERSYQSNFMQKISSNYWYNNWITWLKCFEREKLFHNETQLALENLGENIFMAFGYPDKPQANYTAAIQDKFKISKI